MADPSNIQWCEPCGRVGENMQAHSWCSDCSEPLCEECLKSHPKGKTTANHKTIPILKAEKLGSLVLNIPDTCHIHDDQKLSFFCIHHDQICCAFCLQESHSTCKDVKSIEQASKGVKMGTAIYDVQHRISEFSFMISKILDVYKNNLSSISDQKDEYKEKFRNVRKELNAYLDDLEQEIITKCDAGHKVCESEIEKNIKDLTTRKNKSDSRQTAIETLTEHASETRIFAAIKTIDLLQVEEEVFLSRFQGLMAYELILPPFDFIEKIKLVVASSCDMRIEKTKTTVQHSLNPQQVHTRKIQQGKPQLLHKINSSTVGMQSIGTACFTMDNRIVFEGFPIRVYDITSSSVHTISVTYGSSDITCDLKNNIYTSFPGVGIYNIDIKNLNEGYCVNKGSEKSDFLRVKLNNNFIYSTKVYDVVLFNEKGNFVKTLKCKLNPTFMCVEKSGEIFLSNGKSIIHMTETGFQIEIPTNMKTDETITGLNVDEQGRLYACTGNEEVGSVVRIIPTTGYREPVLENIVTPKNIVFHPTENMFLVITDQGKECSVYKVTN